MSGRRQLALAAGALGIVFVLLLAGKRILGDELSPLGVGAEAPDFTAVTLDSIPREQSLADYRGDVVMVNIWATWCLPCRQEMPSIEQLHKTYGPRGLKIIAVSVDDPHKEQVIRDFVKQYGLTFQILHDPRGMEGEVSKGYQAIVYPQTVIIGRDGIIRKMLLGATDWNSPDNRDLVERLLAEKAG